MPDSSRSISVILPAFHGGAFFKEALESVLAQTLKARELIVVDDASPDERIQKTCEPYGSRIVYMRMSKNAGVAAARNVGIAAATGRYIAFLDEDDVWSPEKLEKQVTLLERLEREGVSPGLVYTGLWIRDENGRMIHKGLYAASGHHFEKMVYFDFIGAPSSVLVPRAVLEDVGPFDEAVRGREDYDMWLRISRKYPVYSLDEYLTRYRQRRGSMSADPAAMVQGLEVIFRKITGDDSFGIYEARVRREAARRYKDAAYAKLFRDGDGEGFRVFFNKGLSYDASLFGWKARGYYHLSQVSDLFCRWVGRMRTSPLKDVRVDVNAFGLNVWARLFAGVRHD